MEKVMEKGRTAMLMVFLLSVAIAISVCVMPAVAKINYESDSTYDYNGFSDCYGEEIHVKVTIDPGKNEVNDLRLSIFEVDALIDDNSFEHTIFPTGANISVTMKGHTVSCDGLKRGESITLMFNAYPKTIKKEEVKVANVRIAYSQLGQRLDDSEEIKAKLDNSFWAKYEEAKGIIDGLQNENRSNKRVFYAGIILAIIAGISLVTQWIGKGKREKEKDAVKRNWRKNLKDVSKKIELAKDNPTEMESLERMLKRDIESINVKGQTKKSTDRRKKRKV
jgi:hypothetical protein